MTGQNHLFSCLRGGSQARDDAPFAELHNGQILTYGALFQRTEHLALTLTALGLSPGDKVAVQIEKSIGAIELYLATVMAGGVFLPLNPAYTVGEMAYFLADAEPKILICNPRNEAVLRPVATASGTKCVLTLAADGACSLADAASAMPLGSFDPVARSRDDLAAMLYTSGTSGRSKGAMLTHGNLASNAGTLAEVWRFGPSDVLIHALPIFHTHGLLVATNVALVSGASLIFQTGFDTDAILEAIPRATVLMGVPTFYTRLLDHPGLSQIAMSAMRLFISGSAPLAAETHARWQAVTGHAILERYGMTETNMNTSNPVDGERRAGTVGLPLPGVEIRITDPETGTTMPDGEVGAIELRGSNVFKGYWRMPEKTADDFRADGFFKSGDIGVIDRDGYLSIKGRSKDLIISGGFNVYPKEVEDRIDEIAGVLESAVIGLPHPDFGEAVVAIVVLKMDVRLDEKAVRPPLESVLARYKQPKKIFFAAELPRNAMGKVLKNLLRETYKDTFTLVL
jgi:malonyl-CoA/methylmalonyl-CoA synthetase